MKIEKYLCKLFANVKTCITFVQQNNKTMKLQLLKRPIPKSIERQDVPHIEVFPDRELTAEQQKEVLRAKLFWQLQLKKTYKKLNS